MDVKHVLTISAGVLSLSGFIPYIRAIVQGRTRPSSVSWLIWAILDVTILAGMFYKNALNGQMIGATAGSCTVACLTIIYGARGWTKSDKYCLVGAVLGIVLWRVLNDPIFGIVVGNTVSFLGSIPTIKLAWEDPGHEDRISWTIWLLSSTLSVLAIPAYTPADVMQPSVFLVVAVAMMYILYFRVPHK